MKKYIVGFVAAALALTWSSAAYAADAAATCQSSKLGTSAKYAQCRLKADAKSVKTGESADYSKCTLAKFADAETKAGMNVCPTEGDQASVQDFLDACSASVAVALDGGILPIDVLTCNEDLATCGSELSSTNSDLGACNSSLGTCTGNLGTCNGNLTTCNGDLSGCQGDLSTTNSDLGVCNTNLSTTNADLTSCEGDLGTATSGTAAVGDVLASKTFTSGAGLGATGTMPNIGQQNVVPGTVPVAIQLGYHDGSGSVDGDADLVAGNIALGSEIFGVAGTALPAQPLKTGQTICYTAGGATTPCSATGQDGELQNGVAPAFIDNGDGTITDNRTGLMWEKLSNDGTIHDKDTTYTWTNAFATKIAGLNTANFAGHNDWRLPNADEIVTLRNLGASNPATYSVFNTLCPASCANTSCSCTASSGYWTSTSYHSSPSAAWVMNALDGNIEGSSYPKGNAWYVRAVRSVSTGLASCEADLNACLGQGVVPQTGQTASFGPGSDGDLQAGAARSFTDNGDGTITDNATNLMWEKKSDDGSIHDKDNVYTWSTGSNLMDGTVVTTFLATLNGGGFAGHSDWRLPNRNELLSLANVGATYPSTFASFDDSCVGGCTVTTCSCTQANGYASSTTNHGNPAQELVLIFTTGDTGVGSKTSGIFVRAVRGGS